MSAKLQDALAVFSTTDVQGALTPNVDELPRLESRHAAAMKFLGTVADTNDLDACVRVLEPEDVRAGFDLAFRRFGQSMDMLLPDPRALAYHADLRWLGKIRGTARARYRDDRLDLSGCGEKVRALIADAVVADGIQILVKEVQLFSPEFDEKVDALGTDDAKASEMEHAIRHEISVRAEENPAFYQSLRERLEEIIAARRQERLDAARQLELLSGLREELRGEQAQAENLGLHARGFAIYGLLEQHRPMTTPEDSPTYDGANRDLPPEGACRRCGRGEAARRLAARARAGRRSAGRPRARRARRLVPAPRGRAAARTGRGVAGEGRRRAPASSSPTSGSTGEAATTAAPSA